MDLVINDKNVYVMSDIHNDAYGFRKLLKIINFSREDILIINGDLFDRGDKPVELYFEILKYPNIKVIQGNHDVWVRREIMEKYGKESVGEYIRYNTVSIMEERLTSVDLIEFAKWIESQPYFINLILNGQKFQIAHAQTYPTPKRILDKSKIYMGDDHYESFLSGGGNDKTDYISVVGHTPTDRNKIWISESGKLIRLDCGNGFGCYGCAGNLGAIRLNDLKEYYVIAEESDEYFCMR